MASFRKRGNSWQAQINMGGVREAGSFSTKAEAKAWATSVEAEIIAGKRGQVPDKTFADLLRKYRDEVSPTKRGARWEEVRLNKVLGESTGKPDPIVLPRLADLNATHVAAWRDRRLKEVSSGSVLREWTLLTRICTVAVKEWKWLRANPFAGVDRPAPPEARNRRVRADEIDRLMLACGYNYATPPATATARVGAAFLFAIETAMRAGEITGLTWDRVFARHVHLATGTTKSGMRRDVPLSAEALRILEQLPRDGELVFNLTSTQLDALFRKCRDRCLIEDLHFHDARHEASTRLSTKLNVMELAKMTGIRDLRILQTVYYNPDVADLADKLL